MHPSASYLFYEILKLDRSSWLLLSLKLFQQSVEWLELCIPQLTVIVPELMANNIAARVIDLKGVSYVQIIGHMKEPNFWSKYLAQKQVYNSSSSKRQHGLKNTWYQMLIVITGIKMMKTCHATWDITAIIPRSWIMEKAKDATW